MGIRPVLAAFGLVLMAGSAVASDDIKSMQIANELGSVLAAEGFCGLAYNQAAISKFIADNVPADDMGFPGMLNMMTEGAAFSQNDMSASSKTAHCAAVARTAASFGFVK